MRSSSYFGVPPPHTLGVPPPPQVKGGTHVPQSMMPPQPSAMGPQLAPACWQVRGVHGLATHWLP